MAGKVPKAPSGLKTSGRALWRAVLTDFVLDEHETTILREACRTADLLDGLEALLSEEGLTSETSQGRRIHPAAAELRAQRVTFARLLTALRIPTGEETEEGRTQGRGAPRGVYPLRGVS
jgi:hypothetical protein